MTSTLNDLNNQLFELQRELLQARGTDRHAEIRKELAKMEAVVEKAHSAHREHLDHSKEAQRAAQKEQELLDEIANEQLKQAKKQEKRLLKKRAKREAKRRTEKERKRSERAAAKKSALKTSLDELYRLQKRMLSVTRYGDAWKKLQVKIQDIEDRITDLSLAGDFSGSSVYSPSEGSAVMFIAEDDDSFVLKHLNDELYLAQQEMLASPKASEQKLILKERIEELDERITLYRKIKIEESMHLEERPSSRGLARRDPAGEESASGGVARSPRWSIELSEEAVAGFARDSDEVNEIISGVYNKPRDSFENHDTESLRSEFSESDGGLARSWSISDDLHEARMSREAKEGRDGAKAEVPGHGRSLSLGSMPGSIEQQLQRQPSLSVDFAATQPRPDPALQEKQWLLSEVEGYRARCESLESQLEEARKHQRDAVEMTCAAWNWRWCEPCATPVSHTSTSLDLQLLRWCEEVLMIQENSRMAYHAVLEQLSSEVALLWRTWGITDHTVSVYGSRRSGLSLPNSDFDLTISCYDEKLGLRHCLATLAAQLGESRFVQHVVAVLGEHVRVPVIKLKMSPEAFELPEWAQLNIDISIHEHTKPDRRDSSMEAVQQLLRELPLLRPLVLLTKQLLVHYDLNDAYNGGLSSYVWLLMVANFLQSSPALHELSLSGTLLALLSYYGSSFEPESTCIRPVLNGVAPPAANGITNLPNQYLQVVDPVTGNVLGGSTFQFPKIRIMFDDVKQLLLSENSTKLWDILDLGFNHKIVLKETPDESAQGLVRKIQGELQNRSLLQ